MRILVSLCVLLASPIAFAQKDATPKTASDLVVVRKSLDLPPPLPPQTDLTDFGTTFGPIRAATLELDGATTIAEPHLAVGGKKHLVVGNVFAAISTDCGQHYHQVPVERLNEGELDGSVTSLGAFCCDQVVHEKNGYFYWIAQHEQGLRLSVISSDSLESGKWKSYAVLPQDIPDPNQGFDFNSVFSTNKHLFVLTRRNLGPQECIHPRDRKTHVPVAIRIPLDRLQAGEKHLGITMFHGEADQTFRGATGISDDTAIFVSHRYDASDYLLNIYEWGPDARSPDTKVAQVKPWSGHDYTSFAPDGGEWLSRIDDSITAAWMTHSGDKRWLGVAWTADGQQSGVGIPHIRCAFVNIDSPENVIEVPLWNSNYSFAYPAVAVDASGNPAFCLSVGGQSLYPSHVVAKLEGAVGGGMEWKVSVAKRGSHSPIDRAWGDYVGIAASPDGVFHSVSQIMQGGRLNRDAVVSSASFSLDPVGQSSIAKHFYAYLDLRKERSVDGLSFGTRDFIDLLPRLSKAGYSAAVISDYHLCDLKRLRGEGDGGFTYVSNLERVREAAAKHAIELIPEVMSVGSSGQILLNNPMLAEGAGVLDSEFVVYKETDSYFAKLNDDGNKIACGDFDADGLTKGDVRKVFRFDGSEFDLSDDTRGGEGKSLVFSTLKTTGLLQQCGIKIKKHHQYEWSFWAKHTGVTEAANEELVLYSKVHGKEEKAEVSLHRVGHALEASQDKWHRYVVVFNSFKFDSVDVSIGIDGAAAGKLHIDDIQLRESQAVNLLQRDDLPIVVKKSNGTVLDQKLYEIRCNPEVGKDGQYLPTDGMPAIRLKADARIPEGSKLLVSYYHAQLPTADSHRVCCSLSHPEVVEIHREQIRLLNRLLKPAGWFVNHDEIRAVGHEPGAKGLSPGELLRQHLVKCLKVIRDDGGNKPVILNGDMFNPYHNAVEPGHKQSYYPMVNGGFKDSWIPTTDKDLESGPEITCWNWSLADQDPGKYAELVAGSYRHFRNLGYAQIVGGFVDVPMEVADRYLEEHFRLAKRYGGEITAASYYSVYRDLCLLEGFAGLTGKVWPAGRQPSEAVGAPDTEQVPDVEQSGDAGSVMHVEDASSKVPANAIGLPKLELVGHVELPTIHRVSAALVQKDMTFIVFDDEGTATEFDLSIPEDGPISVSNLRRLTQPVPKVESAAKIGDCGFILGLDEEGRAMLATRDGDAIRMSEQPIELSGFNDTKKSNNGIEAATELPGGKVLLIEEKGRSAERNAWILSPEGTVVGRLTYDFSGAQVGGATVQLSDTDVSGAATVRDNHIFILHRSWFGGKETSTLGIVCVEGKAFARASLEQNTVSRLKITITNENLLELRSQKQSKNKSHLIDNFEAIVAFLHRDDDYLAVISDDNQKDGETKQRSLLRLYRIDKRP